jgi:hypothetical protein
LEPTRIKIVKHPQSFAVNKTSINKDKQGAGENYIMRSLIICTPHPTLFGW